MNTTQANKTALLAAWIVVILVSLLPMVILQEIFKQEISTNERIIMALGVVVAAFLATLIWKPLKGLRPFLVLFTVWLGSQCTTSLTMGGNLSLSGRSMFL